MVNVNEMDCGRNEIWTMKCGLKGVRWNMNNDVDNVTFLALSLMSLQLGQK